MSILIFAGIVVMWIVVLVPMWLKRHDEIEESRSVDKFTSAMHTLSRRESSKPEKKKYVVTPRNHEYHVSGASAAQRARRPHRAAPRRSAARVAAERRRRTLYGLLGATILTVALAVVVGGIATWAPQLVVDAALVAFMLHLRSRARQAALVRPRRVAPRYQPRVERRREPEPVYDDSYDEDAFEPVAIRYESPVAAVFDQTTFDDEVAYDDDYAIEEPVAVAAPLPAAAVFDQFDEPEVRIVAPSAPTVPAVPAAPPARREVFFDQDDVPDVAVAAAPVTERIASYARDLEIDIPLGEPEPGKVLSSEIGSRPWEPVPVPKPMYQTKPAAPPARRRTPMTSPLLPPIESIDELDPVEDLEEILDRRWAVND
jgi:hypothetical protein